MQLATTVTNKWMQQVTMVTNKGMQPATTVTNIMLAIMMAASKETTAMKAMRVMMSMKSTMAT
jgi:hypothetical protein